MELNELNLFFLLVSKKCVIVKVPIADDVRSDFFGKIEYLLVSRPLLLPKKADRAF